MIRLILALALLLPLFSCEKSQTLSEGKPTVLVSIPPYAFFVKKIAGDVVHIETLIPPGANPHIYEASPKEVGRHQSAALWVYLGESFDKRVLHFFEQTHKEIAILDITQGIDLLSYCEENFLEKEHCTHEHGEGADLHVWLSPRLAKVQAQKIAAALTTLQPEHKQHFSQNLHAFLKELDELDERITALLKPVEGRTILVSHPAFGYFCKDYHLNQMGIEMEGKDPLPQHITEILQHAKQYPIQSVLIEPQYSNKGALLIAESLHLQTHLVDPYAENYSENLMHIAQVIAE